MNIMMMTLLVAARDRDRLGEILQIVSRFGLDVLLARLGLATEAGSSEGVDLPRRTRLALEALGPTFIKLGQILATRGDLLPAEWITELETLHSSAPTLPFEDLRPAVEAALGGAPEGIFASFDTQPLAAASMAQVHRATLPDGCSVVVKIRRPSIRPRMEADLRLIAQAAALVEKASPAARRFAPAAMVRQLAQAVLTELDFTGEGRNADCFREDFADDRRVVIPAIHWQYSSETLLVMDYVEGIAPRDADTLRRAGIDPEAMAALGADIVLDMVLINGRFHGDPHPGNLLCLPGNRMALLDFGMVGYVSPRRRAEFISFVQSLLAGDATHLAEVLGVWSGSGDVPRARLQSAADRLVARHGQGQLVLRALVGDFLPLIREEGLIMPPDLLLIFKALVTLDGVLGAIAPDFNLSQAAGRSFLRLARARMNPDHWGPTALALIRELAKAGEDGPRLLRAAIRRLESEPGDLTPAQDRIAKAVQTSARWIAAAVLGAGALVSGALLLHG